MGSDEERSLKRIYTEPYDFSVSVHDDVRTFLNLKEFAALHDIDGEKVPAVMTDESVNPAGVPFSEGIFRRRKVLYAASDSIARPIPGLTARIDGSPYQVISGEQIQGEMWRIVLESAEVQ